MSTLTREQREAVTVTPQESSVRCGRLGYEPTLLRGNYVGAVAIATLGEILAADLVSSAPQRERVDHALEQIPPGS
ncbi:hypothetical protein EVAR_58550_1 [Eumeta japonica]|uniref:Uncharacterized protein n=1 Tax=Eumeta variegata TaxID=151549 RepID=A0A4C1YHI2_EUMVA|nr:hypothetical protein EVAR_58550_1 [Eumeta japonica]